MIKLIEVKYKIILVLTLLFAFNLSAHAQSLQTKERIDGSIFGFSAHKTPEENGEALDRLSKFVSSKQNIIISIPKGVYKVLRETNNQAVFTNCKNVEINGNGAEFIFQDTKKKYSGAFFRIEKSENFTLRNMVIDWNWDTAPLSAIAQIKEIRSTGIVYQLLHGGLDILPKIHMGREWDIETASRSLKGFPLIGEYILNVEKIDKEHLFIKMKYPERLTQKDVGKYTHIRFEHNYFAGAIYVEDSKSVTLTGITIHAVPETAISCYGSYDFTVEKCNIMPRPGAHKFYSSHSAGEIHNSFGEIIYKDNHIFYSYDDGLHISSGFIPPFLEKDTTNARTLTANYLQYYFLKDVIRVGDVMEFHDANFAPTGFKAKLVGKKWLMNVRKNAAPHNCILIFDRDIPDSLIKGHYIFNTQLAEVKYKILNNTFKYNGCHGIYAGLPNGMIENNSFYRTGYPAVILTLVLRWGRWTIGPLPSNVKINNNHIDECNTASRQPASLFVGAGIDPQGGTFTPVSYRVAKNIEIIGNTIKNTDMPALGLWSAENVNIKDNVFENVGRNPVKASVNKGAVFVEQAANVLFKNNTIKQPKKLLGIDLVIEKNSTQNIRIEGWKKIEIPPQ